MYVLQLVFVLMQSEREKNYFFKIFKILQHLTILLSKSYRCVFFGTPCIYIYIHIKTTCIKIKDRIKSLVKAMSKDIIVTVIHEF